MGHRFQIVDYIGNKHFLEIFVKNVSLLGKIVKSPPDCTKCFQCLMNQIHHDWSLVHCNSNTYL